MEKLFELAIAIGMAVFALRVGSEGMHRLSIGEKAQAYTILSLSAAILAVQVAVILSAFQPTSVASFAGDIRTAAESVAPAEANDSTPVVTNKNVKPRPHHRQHPVASADD